MILVDTSVLIDFLKGADNDQVAKLDEVIASSTTYGIADISYQEVLQGAATRRDFEELKSYLDTIPIYSPLYGRDSFAQAASIFFNCRRKGLTIRSTIDCLIAQISIEHNLALLHNDRDFEHLKKVIPDLRFV
jgi:predicted nucleic acid-binding protein